MFMWGVANPDLKAESIWNYEASYSQWLFNNRMQYGINLFYLKGDNMITVASVDGRMMNVNTGEIENYGVELQELTNSLPISPSMPTTAICT